MLEGLEVSEVAYSEVVNMSNDFRINSEFFSKQFLQLKDGKKLTFLPLKQLAKVADGDHSKFPDNQLEEVRYLQARDITNNFLEITSDVFVSKDYFAKNQRSIITEETILLSIMGTVGDIAITPKGFQASMCNRALAIIRDIKTISPQFLFAFLITKQAANLIERLKNGGVQQRINLDVLGQLEIPNFGSELQDKVTQLVLSAQETRQQTKQKYAQAEQTLLEAVGLADFMPSTQNTNIKTFAQSFGASGRLDAEYYQPKYEEIIIKLKSHENGFFKLSEVANTLRGLLVSDSYYQNSGKVAYIRGADISSNKLEKDSMVYIDGYTDGNDKNRCEKGDIIFSLIGSVGTAANVPEECIGSFVSNNLGIIRVKGDKIQPFVLHLYLTHPQIGGHLFEQQEMRTAQPKISDKDIHNFPIPIIDLATQTNISQLVQQSFTLKARSEHLLNVAKRAVEMAIEQDENAATNFIQQQSVIAIR